MRTWIRLRSIQDRFNFFIENKSFSELKGNFMNMFFWKFANLELIIYLVLF